MLLPYASTEGSDDSHVKDTERSDSVTGDGSIASSRLNSDRVTVLCP